MENSEQVRHTSLTLGKTVLAAEAMKIPNNRIIPILLSNSLHC